VSYGVPCSDEFFEGFLGTLWHGKMNTFSSAPVVQYPKTFIGKRIYLCFDKVVCELLNGSETQKVFNREIPFALS